MSPHTATTPIRRTRLIAVLTIILTALAAVVLHVSPASASGGTGDGDPHQSGCDADARNLVTRENPTGVMTIRDPANNAIAGYGYLRYSPACESEWVTITYNQGYLPGNASFWLQNQAGTDLYNSGYSPWGGKIWTWMYRNMRYRTGCGGVQMYHATYGGAYGSYLGWYYIGCA
jgi:hypothetical protein